MSAMAASKLILSIVSGMRDHRRKMGKKALPTTPDIPARVYRRPNREATVRDPGSKRVRFPLIGSEGPKVMLTSKCLYELIEFP